MAKVSSVKQAWVHQVILEVHGFILYQLTQGKQSSVCVRTSLCMCVCVSVNTNVYMCIYYVCIYVCVCLCVYMYVCKCVCVSSVCIHGFLM